VRSQRLLTVTEDRMLRGELSWRDVETIACLCLAVAERPADTPADLALRRLACCTGALLTTAVVEADDNPVIVANWRQAADEYRDLTAQARRVGRKGTKPATNWVQSTLQSQ
jgi:hypothetical protein